MPKSTHICSDYILQVNKNIQGYIHVINDAQRESKPFPTKHILPSFEEIVRMPRNKLELVYERLVSYLRVFPNILFICHICLK